jgi:hypothetical protein
MLLKVTFIASIVIVIPILCLFRDKPTNAPSAVSDAPRSSILLALKQLCNNRDYLLLLTAFSLNLGAFIMFLNIIDQLIAPFGYIDA